MELLWVNHAGAPRRVDYSWLLVCAAVLIPWSALAGWALDSPLLESTGFSSGNKINPFTGISLLCIAAGWVLLFRAGWPRVARLLALFPLAVSGLRLFESATGKNTTFDFLLFHNRMLNQPHPNHIASNTAIMLLGLALAILLGGKGGWRDELAVWIVIIAGTVPFFAVLGYASQFGLLYGVALQTPMALNGACSGLLLIFPILASLKNTRVLRPFSSLTSGGIMARRLFPLALGIPVVASLLLNTAVNRALVDKVTAIAVLIIAVVILIAVGIHWTASSIDEFDKGRTEQTGIIAEQNRQLTGVVQELRTRSDDLAVAHAALNAVLDAATQVGIVGMDTMGTIRHFNTGAEAILGYKRAEVTGIRTLAAFLAYDTLQTPFESLIEPVRTTFSCRELDQPMVRKDGTTFTADLSLTAQRDERDVVRGYLAVFRDITEMRRNEEVLREAKRVAEEAARSKSDFLATMSHEIRTPMNGVIGMTGLLLDTPLSPEQREYAVTIRNSGEALLGIINDILDFSKIEAGRIELENVDFDLYSTIEECAELVAATAHSKGLELILPLRAASPGTQPGLVRGDQGRLRQVVLNLVYNAVKFTLEGEVAIVVDFQPADAKIGDIDTGMVRIEVRDTGIGIPATVKSQLFTAFTQADSSTTRRFGGTGLGLAISKRLVELMGGEIGVTSEEGRGSTFWFTVRLGRTELQTEAPPPSASGKMLLVVDDNATNRRVLQLQLLHNGYSSRLAQSAAEAMEMLGNGSDAFPFDAVLTDLRMPGMDGFALIASIRTMSPGRKLPILLLTSHEDRERARASGADDVLLKPVREAQLLRSVAKIFAARAAGNRESAEPVRVGAGVTVRRPGRVLVAEDNPVNQKVIALMLKKLGYTAEVVANGREVLSALELGSWDWVLMDCQMPEMDGFEATRAIRGGGTKSAGIPIIALTANVLSGERERCLEAGMDDYLAKPIKPEALNQKLEEWMQRSTAAVASA